MSILRKRFSANVKTVQAWCGGIEKKITIDDDGWKVFNKREIRLRMKLLVDVA